MSNLNENSLGYALSREMYKAGRFYGNVERDNQIILGYDDEKIYDEFYETLIGNFNSIAGNITTVDAVNDTTKCAHMLTTIATQFNKLNFDLKMNRGIMFVGNPGTGKTTLMKAFIKTCKDTAKFTVNNPLHPFVPDSVKAPFMSFGVPVRSIGFVSGNELKYGYSKGGYEWLERFYNRWNDYFMENHILYIDDAMYGIGDANVKSYGTGANPIEDVITNRANAGMVTFGSTNIDLTSNIAPALISRIMGMFNIVKLDDGVDFRTK